VCC
jgi:hypothetical protein